MSSWSVSTPPSCKAGNALQYRDLNPTYNGPRLNKTILRMPVKNLIKRKKGKGLADQGPPIPHSFSWKEIGGNKICTPTDQKACGSCWSFSTTSVLSDRYAIKYNIGSPKLSPLWLVSSFVLPPEYGVDTPRNQRCDTGGNTFLAGQWIEDNFVKLETCWPYAVMTNHSSGDICPEDLNAKNLENCCASCCGNNNSKYKFSIKKGTTKYLAVGDGNDADPETTTMMIQRSIMSEGPVTASFNVPSEFMEWWSSQDNANGGVYIPSSTNYVGGHAVVLTGWGIQNGVRYWELRNSWGKSGDKGYCKFAFSLDTPKEFWTSLDIPSKDGGDWWNGGCVAFEPGDLPQGFPSVAGNGGSAIGSSYSDSKGKYSACSLMVMALVVVIIFLLYDRLTN